MTESGCWLWIGSKRVRYPRINTVGRGLVSVHRAIYMYYDGAIPKGMHVLHKCDNSRCCAPRHLFVRTSRNPKT